VREIEDTPSGAVRKRRQGLPTIGNELGGVRKGGTDRNKGKKKMHLRSKLRKNRDEKEKKYI